MPVASQPLQIHILGLGSIGTLMAHALHCSSSSTSIVLMLHNDEKWNQFTQARRTIRYFTNTGAQEQSTGYLTELYHENAWYAMNEGQIDSDSIVLNRIQYLLVTVKATETMNSLKRLVHRLDAGSTILFLQNGTFSIDEINKYLFPNPKMRPTPMLGVVSHCARQPAPFETVHTYRGNIKISAIPESLQDPDSVSPIKFQDFLSFLCLIGKLNVEFRPYAKFWQDYHHKLAINAVINPLCALNDCEIGDLLRPKFRNVREQLVREIEEIIKQMPEHRHPDIDKSRLGHKKFQDSIEDFIRAAQNHTCSMVYDLRHGRLTEVDFINGYWSKVGKALGVKTPVNDFLIRRIHELEGLTTHQACN